MTKRSVGSSEPQPEESPQHCILPRGDDSRPHVQFAADVCAPAPAPTTEATSQQISAHEGGLGCHARFPGAYDGDELRVRRVQLRVEVVDAEIGAVDRPNDEPRPLMNMGRMDHARVVEGAHQQCA